MSDSGQLFNLYLLKYTNKLESVFGVCFHLRLDYMDLETISMIKFNAKGLNILLFGILKNSPTSQNKTDNVFDCNFSHIFNFNGIFRIKNEWTLEKFQNN